MSPTVGTKLGPYEIVSPLGAGGMGEVYRARDTKLGRDVALKVLPKHVAGDSERMARFKREAQVLASLNHPNIATIHGLEESGGTQALVMELVEGATLAERIKAGAIPLEEALPIARQIAAGLEDAHERGIIHRDLKPANIKITAEGAVKILDFGLAKALETAVSSRGDSAPGPSIEDSPTLSSAATQAGVILGTAAYMSPEQAKGKKVDRRADIWAFGVVLFEMLTAQRLFEGDSTAETLATVMMTEPKWEKLPADVPPSIRKLLARCLEKDPKRRLQAIGEARIAIEETLSRAEAAPPLGPLLTEEGKREARGGEPWRRALPWALAALASAAFLITLGILWRASRSTAPAFPIRSFIPAPDNTSFVFVGDAGGPPVLSPDGQNLAFVAAEASGSPKIYVRPLGSLDARALSGTDNAWAPFWCPDGRRLGFFADGKLKTIDVQGGAPVSLADASNGRGGSWSRDGTIVFAPDFRTPIYRVAASGGAAVAVTRVDESKHSSHRWPLFLPDSKHFLYLAINHLAPRDENDAIYYASLDGKENIRLTAAFTNPEYAAGSLLYVRDGELVARAFDPASGKLSEQEQQVANGVTEDDTTWRAAFSAPSIGLLVYASGRHTQSQLEWYDRAGKQLGSVGETFGDLAVGAGGEKELHLSPRGDRAAVAIQGSTTDIWVMDVARGVRSRLTFGPTGNQSPVWSPDGKWIIYFTVTKEGFAMARRSATGGPEEILLSAADPIYPFDWSKDGKYLLYDKGARGTHVEI
jgi:eukaryotic-like serine/threonine-protein kinase